MQVYRREIFYYETDKMAIVHNANYLRIFEESRLAFMNKAGVPYTSIEKAGILVPQVEAHVRYHHTLKYGDSFCSDVELTQFNGARMSFSYKLTRESDGELIATGYTVHCFLDEEKMLPVNIKKRLPEEYESMRGFIEQ